VFSLHRQVGVNYRVSWLERKALSSPLVLRSNPVERLSWLRCYGQWIWWGRSERQWRTGFG